ncbi:MAG: GDP-L-fucose synthase [Pseudomonadota bacterium]
MDSPDKTSQKIYVAGHRGMAGSAIVRSLQAKGYKNIITATHAELDLRNQADTHRFLEQHKPDYIFIAAAKVGGILANDQLRAEFIYNNLMIECNLIHAAHLSGVQRLCFLGSNCIYPRICPQPIKEEYLLTGLLEPTNEPYAVAKIAGLKLCEAYNAQYGRQYFSVMPPNLFGPNDNYHMNHSHVLPALLRKAHEAKVSGQKRLVVWGTGTPKREFLYIDDFADACTFLMDHNYAGNIINIGSGQDMTIQALADTISKVIGFTGEIVFDASKPDGTPRKLLDISKMSALGWKARYSLEEGIKRSYADFLERYALITS